MKTPIQLVPPNDSDIEEIVLGTLILVKDSIDRTGDLLHADVFYKEKHAFIYSAIDHLWRTSSPVDIATVTQQLRKSSHLEAVGGAYYVTSLTNRVASDANLEYHVKILFEKYAARQVILLSQNAIKSAHNDEEDIIETLDHTDSAIQSIREQFIGRVSPEKGISTLTKDVIKDLETMGSGNITGITTGHYWLDRHTSGFQPSDLIILAARPGMGKTAKILKHGISAAESGCPFIFFSLEMSTKQIVFRLIIMLAKISNTLARDNKLEEWHWDRIHKAAIRLNSLPIHIYDSGAINIHEIKTRCKKIKKKYPGQKCLIGVDYLQLMTSHESKRFGNREQELAIISRGLKVLAKDLNDPIIALSQLSREVEKGTDKRPQLHHLRESGAIEQDADMVMSLYRPSYYFDYDNRSSDPYYRDYEISQEEYAVRSEIIINKFRNGEPNMRLFENYKGENFLFYTGDLDYQ